MNLGEKLKTDQVIYDYFQCVGHRDYVEGLGKVDALIDGALFISPMPPLMKLGRLARLLKAGKISRSSAFRAAKLYLTKAGVKSIPIDFKLFAGIEYAPIGTPEKTIEFANCRNNITGPEMLKADADILSMNRETLKLEIQNRVVEHQKKNPTHVFESLKFE